MEKNKIVLAADPAAPNSNTEEQPLIKECATFVLIRYIAIFHFRLLSHGSTALFWLPALGDMPPWSYT